MDQGCTNEGEDTRLFGRVVCWLQRRFSYASSNPPRLIGWLPWFGISVPDIGHTFSMAWTMPGSLP